MTESSIPSDPIKRRAWIKYQLELAGFSLSSLARELGVSRHAPKLALDHPYPRMEKAIAEKIGIQAQIIWPERYNEQGLSNRTVGRPKKISPSK